MAWYLLGIKTPAERRREREELEVSHRQQADPFLTQLAEENTKIIISRLSPVVNEFGCSMPNAPFHPKLSAASHVIEINSPRIEGKKQFKVQILVNSSGRPSLLAYHNLLQDNGEITGNFEDVDTFAETLKRFLRDALEKAGYPRV